MASQTLLKKGKAEFWRAILGGEPGTDEGGNSIVSACPCGSEDPLGIDVKIDAESVGDKAEQQDQRDRPRMEDPCSADEADDQGAGS